MGFPEINAIQDRIFYPIGLICPIGLIGPIWLIAVGLSVKDKAKAADRVGWQPLGVMVGFWGYLTITLETVLP